MKGLLAQEILPKWVRGLLDLQLVKVQLKPQESIFLENKKTRQICMQAFRLVNLLIRIH